MYIFGALLLCSILPSEVAFFSLTSAGGIPTTAAYALIAILRLTMTPNDFKHSKFALGRLAKPFYVCSAAFCLLIVAVRARRGNMHSSADQRSGSSVALLLPCHGGVLQLCASFVPSSIQNQWLNILQAPVILVAVTIFAVISWWIIPEEQWLSRQRTDKMLDTQQTDSVEEDASVKTPVL